MPVAAPTNLTGTPSIQDVAMTHNGATAVAATITIPQNSRILDIWYVVETAFAGGTVANIKSGSAAAGAEYGANVDAFNGTAIYRSPLTAAVGAARQNVGTNGVVYFTLTPTGTMTTGKVRCFVEYAIGTTA